MKTQINIGYKYEKWTVIDDKLLPTSNHPSNQKYPYGVLCQCECGNQQVIHYKRLLNKSVSKQCRECFYSSKDRKRKYDLKRGDFVGNWEILEDTKQKTKVGHYLFKAKCSICGVEVKRPYNSLSTNGCNACFQNNRVKWYGEISLNFFNRIKDGAKLRQLDFDITIEYIWNLFLQQNRKCALSKLSLKFDTTSRHHNIRKKNTTASLDRIDSSKGYIEGNIQWVHKTVNRMKMDLNEIDFFELCNAIAIGSRRLVTFVSIILDIEGQHYWPDANNVAPKVGFLQHPHRHTFTIKASKQTKSGDPNRDIELILFKREITHYLYDKYFDEELDMHNFNNMSCEMIADDVCKEFYLDSCEVWEDNEVGAIVKKDFTETLKDE